MTANIDLPRLRHVAIIMDGNNRWAKKRGLPGAAGHKAGVERVRDILDVCKEAGIETVTVFAFSSENWQRPTLEVNALMSLFGAYLKNEKKKLKDEGVTLRVIGDRQKFSSGLCKQISEAEAFTSGGKMTLVIAADYGGRWDIAQAARNVAAACVRGDLTPADIDEACLGREICLGDLPPVDLLIRTGGEKRISNFLLWHAAYAELYFSDLYWPDFGPDAMQMAIQDFYTRQRRFGLSGDQVGHSA
ncbi:MAG TPA: polyprenyl diphosphate synthase [Pseudomonadales bacterium]|nr:polyprenyl diphosphate synthase [Pseudomonadales bacterium]